MLRGAEGPRIPRTASPAGRCASSTPSSLWRTAETPRPRPGSRGRSGKILLHRLRLVQPEAPRLVARQRGRGVQGAGVDPDAGGPHRPGALDGGGEQGAADPAAQEAGEETEVDQLDLVSRL